MNTENFDPFLELEHLKDFSWRACMLGAETLGKGPSPQAAKRLLDEFITVDQERLGDLRQKFVDKDWPAFVTGLYFFAQQLTLAENIVSTYYLDGVLTEELLDCIDQVVQLELLFVRNCEEIKKEISTTVFRSESEKIVTDMALHDLCRAFSKIIEPWPK